MTHCSSGLSKLLKPPFVLTLFPNQFQFNTSTVLSGIALSMLEADLEYVIHGKQGVKADSGYTFVTDEGRQSAPTGYLEQIHTWNCSWDGLGLMYEGWTIEPVSMPSTSRRKVLVERGDSKSLPSHCERGTP